MKTSPRPHAQTLWLGCAAALVGAALFVERRMRAEEPRAAAADAAHRASEEHNATAPSGSALDELAPLRQRLSAVENELRRSRSSEGSQAQEAVVDEAEPAAAPHPPLSPAAVHQSLDARLLEERADPTWAPREEQSFKAFFADAARAHGQLTGVACRETLCQLRVRFKSAAERGRFEQEQLGTPPFDQGGFLHTDETTGELLLYTARAGQQLVAGP